MLSLENGMRPKQNGVPKIVLTITDGVTWPENLRENLKPAVDILKKREFNLIAVGIKGADSEEYVSRSFQPARLHA
jgi:hypothetical protein